MHALSVMKVPSPRPTPRMLRRVRIALAEAGERGSVVEVKVMVVRSFEQVGAQRFPRAVERWCRPEPERIGAV
ncbi:hypothetical protein DN545_35415 [Burkholderia multivorans]|nr:hypothetical protein DN545_35415 [Burkholderia multivorans]